MSFGYEIITYGGGENLTLLFNGIAAAVGESNYTTLIRIFAMFGLGWILIESTFKQSFVLNARWFIGFILFYNVLLVPKVTVHIVDRVHHDQIQAVAHVPWGLAIFASIASEVGDTITHVAEKTFTLPDDLKYSQTGTVMASSLIKSASDFKITDPDFAKNMREFMQQCVFYDVLLGKYSMRELYNTPDVWRLVSTNASPARAFSYIDKSGRGTIKTCKDGIQQLNQDWKIELDQASLIYGQRFFPNSNKAKAQLLSSLPISYQYLAQLSQSAAQLMQQNMMANALQQGLIGQAATTDAAAAIQGYAVTRANEMKRSTYQITGELAGRWLPIMKNVFEAMFYGSFLFLFLVMLLPMGASVLRGYVMSLFWLQSWAPLYTILNLVMTLDAKTHSLAAVSNGGLTIATVSGLAQVNSDTAALAGYLSMSIPFIAYGIVKGGASAFTHLAGSIGGVSQSAASGAAAEATTGNYSLGNTHFNTHSANNASANHVNTNASFESGMTSYQTGTGAMVHHTPGGYDVIDNRGTTISHTATAVNLADSIRAGASQQYDQSITAAKQSANSFTHSMTTALRGIYDLSATQGNGISSDETSSISQSGGTSQSINNVKELVDRFASSHGLTTSQAVQVLGAASTSLDTGVGVSAGGRFGARASAGIRADINGLSRAESSAALQAASDFMKSERFSENLDTAIRGVHDQHYRSNSDEGQRLAQSVSNAYDQADTARHEMSSSLQQAESYRSTMNMTTEQAASINQQGSQALVEWMKNKPAPGSQSGYMSAATADHILNHQPELAKAYASEFIKEKGMVNQWQHSMGSSAQVQTAYQSNNHAMPNSQQIENTHHSHQSALEQQSTARGLGEQHKVNSSIPSHADNIIQQTDKVMTAGQAGIAGKGFTKEQLTKLHTNPNNHDLTSRAVEGAKEAVKSTFKSDDI